jgi:hypothetical protein
MRTMVQSSRWLLQLILVCIFIQLGTPCFGRPEHSGMGIHKERNTEAGIGNLYMFVLYVIVSEYGKKLDNQAKCPLYCGINHKHNYHEKEKSYIQGNDELPRPGSPENREQSKGGLRPIASTD